VNNAYCGPGTEPLNGVCVLPDASVEDVTPDTTGSPEASDAATHVEADTQGDGAADGNAASDDPCPPSLDVNCSTTCGGPSANCYDTVCPASLSDIIQLYSTSLPFTIRTTSDPGVGFWCDGGHPVCGGIVRAGFGVSNDVAPLIVRVGPPWFISQADNCAFFYPEASLPPTGCAEFSAIGSITVFTTDPHAPARNIMISSGVGDHCP
jgi:hypothetical protein